MAAARVMRGEMAGGLWEIAMRAAPLALRDRVHELVGYVERTPGVLRRRELPGPFVPLILELGPPLRVGDPSERFAGGFAAGLHTSATQTEHDGLQSGVQVNLTPIGARLFFGMPMAELTARVVSLRDLLPREQGLICERIGELASWDARFDAIEAWLRERFDRAALDVRVTEHAFRRIVATRGALDVRTLARELGYSHEHVIRLFRDQVGLAPKALARVVRFHGLLARVRGSNDVRWAQLAEEHGYYDQAHLVREVRALSGVTPTTLRGELVDLGGLERP